MKIIMHNGVPCVKAKVHRLPTEDVSRLWELESGSLICEDNPLKTKTTKTRNNQYLYFTTDKQGKQGWNYNQATGEIIFLSRDYEEYSFEWNYCRKIIATTDPKLKMDYDGTTSISKDWAGKLILQIPQSFIEQYCKAGGIDEVLVELKFSHSTLNEGHQYTPKLNPDNTIIIHPVEEKIEISLDKLKEAFGYYSGIGESPISKSELEDDFREWIEENL